MKPSCVKGVGYRRRSTVPAPRPGASKWMAGCRWHVCTAERRISSCAATPPGTTPGSGISPGLTIGLKTRCHSPPVRRSITAFHRAGAVAWLTPIAAEAEYATA
ncbi:hypothetical protein G6F59_017378 [Rhizopus arrhizus]|nr:hypothetical protein G6F59_017378 [Rhizopus arrhizus]